MTLYETKIAHFSTQRNLFYDLDSFRFAYPFRQFQTNIMELDFLEKKFLVPQKSTAHRQPSHSCFQRRKTPFSRF